jgi:hypothetical protein
MPGGWADDKDSRLIAGCEERGILFGRDLYRD